MWSCNGVGVWQGEAMHRRNGGHQKHNVDAVAFMDTDALQDRQSRDPQRDVVVGEVVVQAFLP